MDKRLEQALDFSNFRMILLTRQENLKVLMNNKLMLNYGGGLFKVDKELLSHLFLLMAADLDKFIFIDSNDIPIAIKNIKEFADKAMEQYRKALEQYYKSYQKLTSKNDKLVDKSIIDIERRIALDENTNL